MTKEIAIIVEQNTKNQLLPQVLVLRDKDRNPVTLYKVLDLYEIDQAGGKVRPKIVNTYALGTFDIGVDEITEGLNRATKGEGDEASKPWAIKSLIKKMVS